MKSTLLLVFISLCVLGLAGCGSGGSGGADPNVAADSRDQQMKAMAQQRQGSPASANAGNKSGDAAGKVGAK